jgi:hypothetical protein
VTIHVPNPEVLQAGFASIQANLAFWNQQSWVQQGIMDTPQANTCGTTACLAGHIVLAAGFSWDQLKKMNVPLTAMSLLGYGNAEDPDDEEPDYYDGDGNEFNDIFYRMRSDRSGLNLEYSQEAFDEFKAEVSELTGVEL